MDPQLFFRFVPARVSVMVSATALLLFFCGSAARADDRTICGDAKSSIEATLQACTRIIAGPQPASFRDRVIALDRRGVAFVKQGDFEPAMSDFNAAVGLAPHYPMVRLHRADLLNSK